MKMMHEEGADGKVTLFKTLLKLLDYLTNK